MRRPLVDRFHPVTQSRTGPRIGNCTEATFASLLGVSLDAVPDLYVPESPTGRTEARYLELLAWMHGQGVRLVDFEFTDQPVPLPAPKPFPLAPFDARARRYPQWWERLHLMGGPNPDGVPHLCVGKALEVYWDPNPLRRGIVACDYLGILLPEDEVLALFGQESLTWPGIQLQKEEP